MRELISLELKISQIKIGINIGNSNHHLEEFHRFRIQLNIKKTLMSLILIKIINSVTINTKKAFSQIHIIKLKTINRIYN